MPVSLTLEQEVAVLLSLFSKAFPNAKVTAWDVSEDALCIARRNNDDLQASVCFVKQDVLAWRGDGGQCYDVIVSNPPYITESEKARDGA